MNGMLVKVDEVGDGAEAGLEDEVVDTCEVGRTTLEGTSAYCQKVGRGNASAGKRMKEGLLGNVEGEKWVNTMDHVIRTVTSGALNRNTFGPDGVINVVGPWRIRVGRELHEAFPKVEMATFDNAVGARVVGRNLDVEDVVLAEFPGEVGRERRTVVGNNFENTAPAADNVLENELGGGFGRIGP